MSSPGTRVLDVIRIGPQGHSTNREHRKQQGRDPPILCGTDGIRTRDFLLAKHRQSIRRRSDRVR